MEKKEYTLSDKAKLSLVAAATGVVIGFGLFAYLQCKKKNKSS